MKTRLEKARQFLQSIKYCCILCWEASPFYTLLRLVGKLYQPLSGIISAFISKIMLDLLTQAAPDSLKDLLLVLLASFIVVLIGMILQKGVLYAESIQNDIIQKQITLNMMDKALNADLSLFDNAIYNDRFQKVQEDSQSLSYVTWNAIDCVSSIVSFIGTFTVLCGLNLWYGVFMTIAAIPAAMAGQKYTKSLYHFETEQINSIRKRAYINFLATSRNYAQEVRLYDLGSMLKARYIGIWENIFYPRKALVRKRSLITTVMELLPEVVIIGINLDVAVKVFEKSATIGDFSLYSGILVQLSTAILMTISAVNGIYDNQLKIENVRSFEDIPKLVKDRGTCLITEIEQIEFDHVSFYYPNTKKTVLDNVSFVIHNKEKLALVGINGSGKSTIVKLLLRFYDPTNGRILINGKDIRSYPLKELRDCFTCYFQNSLNYGFSVLDNIEISRQDIKITDYDKVWQALYTADADEMVLKMEKGLNTSISRQYDSDGIELSGGQYQKIALARTFYRNTEIFVLDEPSSSLDPESEARLFDAMKTACIDKTVLLISHRLSNISLADRIIVLENGQIIEQGTQSELLNINGRFATLYQYQMNKLKGTSEDASCIS